jgi:3-dehydroquinate dehydratase-2
MKILVLNGPNINMLGVREKEIYGDLSYKKLKCYIKQHAKALNLHASVFQSNSESSLITSVQKSLGKFDGIVINAAAFTHTSVGILDALKAVNIKTVEVHLSDITTREEFRKFSYISLYASKVIAGKGFEGYKEALEFFKVTSNK